MGKDTHVRSMTVDIFAHVHILMSIQASDVRLPGSSIICMIHKSRRTFRMNDSLSGEVRTNHLGGNLHFEGLAWVAVTLNDPFSTAWPLVKASNASCAMLNPNAVSTRVTLMVFPVPGNVRSQHDPQFVEFQPATGFPPPMNGKLGTWENLVQPKRVSRPFLPLEHATPFREPSGLS
jgi:hypothetical protein